MFDKGLLETDAFMDMPMPTKALYFLLGMEADDEGFVSPSRVMRIYGGNADDLKVLIAKKFVIQFESGVIVITDWKKNNWLDSRRVKKTVYEAEKALISESNEKYILLSDRLAVASPEEHSGEEKSTYTACGKISFREGDKTRMSSLQVATNYISDGFSPLDRLAMKRRVERSLGLKRANKWSQLLFGSAWDFRTAFKKYEGYDYPDPILLDEVAKTLAHWFELGETRDSIRDMLIAFFEGKKHEKVTITPNSVFSSHTYNSWKQNKL